MIRMVGAIVGCAGRAETLASNLEAGLDAVRAAASAFSFRPRAFFEEWDDPLISGIRWVEELVEIAGGNPIFPELRNAKMGKDRIVDAGDVAYRNPDIVIASWCGKAVRAEKIARREGWSAVAAVRDGRIYEIKSALILQPGPAALTDGLKQIHGLLAKVVSSRSERVREM